MKHPLIYAGALVASYLFPLSAATILTEFQPNPTGADPSTSDIELSGDAGTSFDLWIISIETDNSSGQINDAENITGTFDANGLAVVSVSDLENPSFTLALVDEFTGSTSDTLTSSSDLVDLGITTVLDAINIVDATGDLPNSAIPLLGIGIDFAFSGDEPQLVFRDSVTSIWYAVNDPADPTNVIDQNGNLVPISSFTFDPTATSFGSINSTIVPEPSSALLGGIGLVALLRRKR